MKTYDLIKLLIHGKVSKSAESSVKAESPEAAAVLWLCPGKNEYVCRVSSAGLPEVAGGIGLYNTCVSFTMVADDGNVYTYHFVLKNLR